MWLWELFMPYIIDEHWQILRKFEKIFGRYKSDRIRRCQKVLSGDKHVMSSSYSNFLYEISLYLKIRVSEVKQLFSKDCEYLYSLCDHVYRRFRRRFRKMCAKNGLAAYIAEQNLRKWFSWYRYVDWRIFTQDIFWSINDFWVFVIWNCYS